MPGSPWSASAHTARPASASSTRWHGDLTALRELAAQGRTAEGGPQAPLRLFTEFLDWLDGRQALRAGSAIERLRHCASASCSPDA
jgi:hypothetical protein